MPPLTDPEIRRKIGEALLDSAVRWRQRPAEWLRAELEGHTQARVQAVLSRHVLLGGKVSQAKETRPEYLDWGYHYDFQIRFTGRLVYIETVLDDTQMGPVLHIVNMKDAEQQIKP